MMKTLIISIVMSLISPALHYLIAHALVPNGACKICAKRKRHLGWSRKIAEHLSRWLPKKQSIIFQLMFMYWLFITAKEEGLTWQTIQRKLSAPNAKPKMTQPTKNVPNVR